MLNRIDKVDASAVYLNWLILIVRIAIMAFMLTHGFPKLLKILEGGELKFANPIGLGMEITLYLAVFSEFFCSIFIGIGFRTRLATLPLIATMGIAAFISHADDPFGSKEKALLYLIIYVMLFVIGGRKFSLDRLFSKKKY